MKTTCEPYQTTSTDLITNITLKSEVGRMRHAIEQIRLSGETILLTRGLSAGERDRMNRFLQFVYEISNEVRETGKLTRIGNVGDIAAGWAVQLTLAASSASLYEIDQNYASIVKTFGESCLLLGRLEGAISDRSSDVDDYRALFAASIDYTITESVTNNDAIAA